MARRTYNQNALKVGSWLADCDRCGFQFHHFDLKKEWTGLMVCYDCHEVRHPQDFVRGVPDNPSVPWTRPTSIPPTIEYNDDTTKTLVSGTNLNIQDWNTDLTHARVVTLSAANAKKGDRFIIYKTGNDEFTLYITTETLDSGNTV
jgi:hypothetical protein